MLKNIKNKIEEKIDEYKREKEEQERIRKLQEELAAEEERQRKERERQRLMALSEKELLLELYYKIEKIEKMYEEQYGEKYEELESRIDSLEISVSNLEMKNL